MPNHQSIQEHDLRRKFPHLTINSSPESSVSESNFSPPATPSVPHSNLQHDHPPLRQPGDLIEENVENSPLRFPTGQLIPPPLRLPKKALRERVPVHPTTGQLRPREPSTPQVHFPKKPFTEGLPLNLLPRQLRPRQPISAPGHFPKKVLRKQVRAYSTTGELRPRQRGSEFRSPNLLDGEGSSRSSN